MERQRRQQDPVVRITAAPRPHHEDQHARIVRYTVSMSIRVVCLVLAFVTTGPLQWVMVAGAVVLPYIAVVFANAGRERTQDPSSYAGAAPVAPVALPAPPSGTVPGQPGPRDPGDAPEVVPGEVWVHPPAPEPGQDEHRRSA